MIRNGLQTLFVIGLVVLLQVIYKDATGYSQSVKVKDISYLGGAYAVPVTWVDFNGPPHDPLIIPVTPVELNIGGTWGGTAGVGPTAEWYMLQQAAMEWSEASGSSWDGWRGVELVLQPTRQKTINLSSVDELSRLYAGAEHGGFPENNGGIFIYYCAGDVADAIRNVYSATCDDAGCVTGFAYTSLTDSQPPLVARPHVYFGSVFILADSPTIRASLDAFHATVKHELGHALGLDHSTALAVMAAGTSGLQPPDGAPLTLDDISGIQALYGAHTGLRPGIPPVGMHPDVGIVSVQLQAADRPCVSFPDECWFAAGRVLVEYYIDGLDVPVLAGVTGWSVADIGGYATGGQQILLGRVDQVGLPTDESYRILYRPINEDMRLFFDFLRLHRDPGESPPFPEWQFPAFDPTWYNNASTRDAAWPMVVVASAGVLASDAVGFDGDADGVSYYEEVSLYRTDPDNPDSDHDGKLDGDEISQGTPPLNARPVAIAPEEVRYECDGAYTSVALDGSKTYDPEGDDLTLNWSGPFPENGGKVQGTSIVVSLPLGVSVITLVASDPFDRSEPILIVATVEDNTPPDLHVEATPNTIWPPNHKFTEVHIRLTKSDECDGQVTTTLRGIEIANEAGPLDLEGNVLDATFGSCDTLLKVLAERSGKGEREYSLIYEASDRSGNTTWDTCLVMVPHDKGLTTSSDSMDGPDDAAHQVGTLIRRVFPVPCTGQCTVEFAVGQGGSAVISVFDIFGRRVKAIVLGYLDPGAHLADWDTRDEHGQEVPEGIYFLRLQVGASVHVGKVVVLR